MRVYISWVNFRYDAQIPSTPIKYFRRGDMRFIEILPHYEIESDCAVVGVIFAHDDLLGLKTGSILALSGSEGIASTISRFSEYRRLIIKPCPSGVAIESTVSWERWLALSEENLSSLCEHALLKVCLGASTNDKAVRI